MMGAFGSAVDSWIASWALDLGIEIDPSLNVHLSIAKTTEVYGLELFREPVIKFAFQYRPPKAP